MNIFLQLRVNGILYTLKAQTTSEFPSKEIPFGDNLKEQFKDIIENHAALAMEEVERPAIHATAAAQVREYEESKKAA